MTKIIFPNTTMARLDALVGTWSTRIVMLDVAGAEADVFNATDIVLDAGRPFPHS